jgi:hypothetical protein
LPKDRNPLSKEQNKHSNKRTNNEQTNKQTPTQQTNEQTNKKQTNKQTNKSIKGLADKHIAGLASLTKQQTDTWQAKCTNKQALVSLYVGVCLFV